MFSIFAQFFLIPRICGWPTLLSVSLSLCLYAILTLLIIAFHRSFKVWRSSLASRYEQQCQKSLHAFNLQLCDGVSVPMVRPGTPTAGPGGVGQSGSDSLGASSTALNSPNANAGPTPSVSIDHALKHGPGVGFHLAFVRRMPRRLVAFLEAYREEYRARRRYCLQLNDPTKKHR